MATSLECIELKWN